MSNSYQFNSKSKRVEAMPVLFPITQYLEYNKFSKHIYWVNSKWMNMFYMWATGKPEVFNKRSSWTLSQVTNPVAGGGGGWRGGSNYLPWYIPILWYGLIQIPYQHSSRFCGGYKVKSDSISILQKSILQEGNFDTHINNWNTRLKVTKAHRGKLWSMRRGKRLIM